MRLLKPFHRLFQHVSRSEERELRAEVEALRYLVKILLIAIVSTEPRQAAQELQDLVAAIRYAKIKADDDTDDAAERLTETAQAKALSVIEAVKVAVLR